MVAYLLEFRQVSIGRACRVVKLPKSMYYYKNIRDDSATIDKLLELSERHPTEGQDLYYSRIRQQGLQWNYKRVRRVFVTGHEPPQKGSQACASQGKSTTGGASTYRSDVVDGFYE